MVGLNIITQMSIIKLRLMCKFTVQALQKSAVTHSKTVTASGLLTCATSWLLVGTEVTPE